MQLAKKMPATDKGGKLTDTDKQTWCFGVRWYLLRVSNSSRLHLRQLVMKGGDSGSNWWKDGWSKGR